MSSFLLKRYNDQYIFPKLFVKGRQKINVHLIRKSHYEVIGILSCLYGKRFKPAMRKLFKGNRLRLKGALVQF